MTVTERFRHVEIEINSVCDMDCPCCDRFVDCAPTGPMKLEQVKLFVEESLDLGWEWERIHVLGGEPTLHKQLRPIIESLVDYRTYYPKVLLRLISNGSGMLKQRRPWLESQGIAVNVESKDGTLPTYFCNMRRAPKDILEDETPFEPCSIFGIRGCGLGLTKHGFFLCGAGAAIARVCGLDIGIMKLADVNWESIIAQARYLCNVCGHHETVHSKASEDGGVVTKFWEDAMANYRKSPTVLKLYGE